MRSLLVTAFAFFLNSCAPAFIGGVGVSAIAIEDRRTALLFLRIKQLNLKQKKKSRVNIKIIPMYL